ncbi:multiheme c-type cytochrome [Zavarzinella formosa]|uniref:multiheme c-type cytochrome n=1 Tax=Zavarzinella formosa TaxID=360055 RepID=UPI0002EABCAA|nr:multiheme c-type cytochrome [Zavarzinella formosa]
MPARYLFLGLLIGGVGLGWYAVAGRPVVSTPSTKAPDDSLWQVTLFKTGIGDELPRSLVLNNAVGNSGCSAQGCHGAVMPRTKPLSIWGADDTDRTRWRESSTIFNGHDPHRLAFDVLKNDRSAGIQRRLQTTTPASEDSRCLACHSNPTMANDKSEAAKAIHADGVSCEACHGNSSGWIDAHTKWDGSTNRQRAYVSTGMTQLNEINVRAMTCLRCHVGSEAEPDKNTPRRDVNHDLIAAGHPRLNFDFATYMERLPAHWVEKDRGEKSGVFRNQSVAAWYWVIGRQASNTAAYRLLADRATLGEKAPQAWPELSENDCFSCHRGLDPERKKFSQPPARITGGLGRESPPILHALQKNIPHTDAVEALMRKPGQSPAELAKLARAAAAEWENTIEAKIHESIGPGEDRILAKKLAAADPPMTWAEACQRFYALDYFNRMGKKGLDKEIDAVRPLLRFQRDPIEINSPATSDLPTAGRKLKEIAERLSQPAPPDDPAKK